MLAGWDSLRLNIDDTTFVKWTIEKANENILQSCKIKKLRKDLGFSYGI
jgi:hypothetical protein